MSQKNGKSNGSNGHALAIQEHDWKQARREAVAGGREPPAPPPGVVLHYRPPVELTDELIDKIKAKILHRGVSPEVVARAYGVRPTLFRQWLLDGLAGLDELCVKLCAEIDIAAAQFECETVRIILDRRTARQEVAARQWHLSRMQPDRWGDRLKQEVTGSSGGPVVIAAARLPPEDDDP